MITGEELQERLAAYLRGRLNYEEPRVISLRRFAGGVSRETMGGAFVHGPPANRVEKGLVLRLDPPASLLASNRHVEYAVLRALEAEGAVPVPHAICVEDDPAHLGTSFLMVDLLPGDASMSAIMKDPYLEAGPAIARRAFEVLADIARLDWRGYGLGEAFGEPGPEPAWSQALTHWETVLDTSSLGPEPLIRMAIRALRRNPPPVAPIALVHGDYRLGNVLYTESGTISGVIDWEMAHLGDPLEDLAWAMHSSWQLRKAPGKPFGHIDSDQAVATYERAIGRLIDRRALRWWALLAQVKFTVLGVAAGYSFVTEKPDKLVQALVAWHSISWNNRLLAEELERASA